jgi:hypothetical protein
VRGGALDEAVGAHLRAFAGALDERREGIEATLSSQGEVFARTFDERGRRSPT